MSEQTATNAAESEDSAEDVTGVGSLLRASRQRVGEELRDVATMLRIRYPYLEAIEEGRFAELPGQTYAVGFVRAYAEHLGLDSEEVVRRFKAEIETGGPRHDLHFPTPVAETGIPGGALVFVGLVISVVAYGGWYLSTTEDGFFSELVAPLPDRLAALVAKDDESTDAASAERSASESEPESKPEAEPTPEPESKPVSEATPEPVKIVEPQPAEPVASEVQSSVSQTTNAPASEPQPETQIAPEPVPQAESQTQVQSEPVAEAAPEPTSEPASSPQPTSGSTTIPDVPAPPVEAVLEQAAAPEVTTPEVTMPEVATPEAAAPEIATTEIATPEATTPEATTPEIATPEATADVEPTPSVVRIVVRATSNSWIEVRDDFSNSMLVSRLLREGESFEVPDKTGLSLHTGNAGALEILVDGETVPAIGAGGAVLRGVQLDPDLLKAGAAAQ